MTAKEANIASNQYLQQYLAPYKKHFSLAYAIALLSLTLLIIQNALLAWIFADWINAFSQQQPLNIQVLKRSLPYLAACMLLRPWLESWKTQHLQNISRRIRVSLRQHLVEILQLLGPERRYYGSDGSLSTQLIEQVDALDGYIGRYYIQKYLAITTPIIIAILAFYYSPLAAILLLSTAPLVPIFMILVGKAAANNSREQLQSLAQLASRFLDLLRGMPTLKRLNATTVALHNIHTSASQYQKKTMGVLGLAFLSGAILELFASLSIALVALYLGLGLLGILPWSKEVTPVPYQGALFILLLAPEFYAPLRLLGSDYHAKAKAEASMQTLSYLLDRHTLLLNPDDTTQHHSQQTLKLDSAPSIILEKITIFAPDQRLRLAQCSLHIASAERIAINGQSGLGKSSLLQAILGFAPVEGQIRINGHDYAHLNLEHLRTYMAYLEQSPPLMPMSIADNLRLADTHACDEELKKVLLQVQLWPLISQLPQGIHTLLGERGQGLSGGQQQRLALAQLLLQNRPLWLLDEPCAHLDPQTANDIYHLIGKLSIGKTLILVTHDEQPCSWLDHCYNLEALINKEAVYA